MIVSERPAPAPEWRWALPVGRVLTLVVLATITVVATAPVHRVAVGAALLVSIAGVAYGLRFGPLQWGRRLVGLALFAAGGVAMLAIDAQAPGWLAAGVALSAGLVRLPQRPSFLFAAAVAVTASTAPLVRGDVPEVAVMAAICGGFATAGLMLAGIRNRAVNAERLLEAEQFARESALATERLAERQRLAHEIHDILAHTLSAQAVQLEGARMLVERGAPVEAVRTQIQAAQRLARDGLEETRRAVQSLRGDARPLAETLRALASTADAKYEESGEPWPLDASASLVIEHTVQEGLTNARKYAPGAAVTVSMDYRPEQLRVEVHDTGGTGRATTTDGGGYGLAAMRERAALLGASLSTGPDGKGYRICLTLPRSVSSAS